MFEAMDTTVGYLRLRRQSFPIVCPGSWNGDCISLKVPRLMGRDPGHEGLWNFLDVAGVPDISGPLLADKEEMANFVKLTCGSDAEAFREWFHENAHLTEKE